MKRTRGPRVFVVAISFVMLVLLIDTVEAEGGCNNDTDEVEEGCKNDIVEGERGCKKPCPEFPRWVDWRTPEAKKHCPRKRLTEDPFGTTLVVIGAILIVLVNALLCHLLFWDETFWSQRTYKMLFSLACNDCITGIFLAFGVLTEMKSFQDYTRSPILCKIVIAGLWLCVVTSIYTFTVISVARWLMLNHPRFYNKQFQDRPLWTSYIGIASCWLAGACHAIPLLTSWNDECVTDFTTCSLPYKSPLWIWSAALTVFFIPSLIIVVVYSLILRKMRTRNHERSLAYLVTKTMSILTAAFLLVWWPLCIFLSIRWNTVGGTRGFYAGAISCLVNPILLICINSTLKAKVVVMFRHIVYSKK